jgi:hypothetical protein
VNDVSSVAYSGPKSGSAASAYDLARTTSVAAAAR